MAFYLLTQLMSRKTRIKQLLSTKLGPSFLSVEDESHRHHVPPDTETHIKVTLVSTRFHDMSRVERHRLINTIIVHERQTGLHALSLHLYTPEEWQIKISVPDSPSCRNGKHLG